MANEILVVPFFGQGHLFPCSELCKHLALRSYQITLLIPSFLSSSISPSLHDHPLIKVSELPILTPSPDSGGPMNHHHGMVQLLSDFLSSRSNGLSSSIPVCAIVDVMMGWTLETIGRFQIPIISFFTSSACSAAMEYALWKVQPLPEKPTPDLTIALPGLPQDMCLTFSDLTRRDPRPPHRGRGLQPPHPGPPPPSHHNPDSGGGPPPGSVGNFPPPPGPPPTPGHRPPWASETESSLILAILINTCDDLERPFIEYLANQMGKPVWGVGPLLPKQYWHSADSTIHDREIRTERKSSVSEDEISEWLDLKPRGSVIYVSFGTEVSPESEEQAELADALEESNRPFIWVVQSAKHGPPGGPPGLPGGPGGPGGDDFFPDGLADRVGGRGLIIKGWAPQLLILSHPSTGGFLSHCGWNSIVEAIGQGVPILAWPIRGDQPYNAKLVTCHLKVGLMIQEGDRSKAVTKHDILCGITNLMADDETRKRATSLRAAFDQGFPASSLASLDALRDFVNLKKDTALRFVSNEPIHRELLTLGVAVAIGP